MNEPDPVGRKIVHDRLERSPEVGRYEDVGPEIILAMIVERHVDRRGIEVRRFDPRYPGARGHAREALREVGPRAAVIRRHPHVAVVSSGEENSRPDRRLGDGCDRSVSLRAGRIARNSAGRLRADVDAHRISSRKIG